jgi:uncharacterized protein (DUF924 family)
MTMPERARTLLDFWFGVPGTFERHRPRALWFDANAAFDAALRERFQADQEGAHAGALDHWREEAESCLALLLLLDQLPRNLYRGTARAFASDARARDVARHAIARGFDRDLPPVWRWFLYLPFEHSETLSDQGLSLRLHARLPEDEDKASCLAYAREHYDTIARFGRFPRRNRALGRISTAEEEAFLEELESQS